VEVINQMMGVGHLMVQQKHRLIGASSVGKSHVAVYGSPAATAFGLIHTSSLYKVSCFPGERLVMMGWMYRMWWSGLARSR
jgi:hypothetical protein